MVSSQQVPGYLQGGVVVHGIPSVFKAIIGGISFDTIYNHSDIKQVKLSCNIITFIYSMYVGKFLT